MKRAGALAAVALALAGGCGRSAEAQEADRVARAIDLVRDAPNDPVEARRDLLAKLEAEPATGKQAVSARDACVAAYRPFFEGQELEARVRAQLGGPPDQVPPTVITDLAAAEAKVSDAKTKMPACDRALHELKHAFP